jgi:hypothetical protein
VSSFRIRPSRPSFEPVFHSFVPILRPTCSRPSSFLSSLTNAQAQCRLDMLGRNATPASHRVGIGAFHEQQFHTSEGAFLNPGLNDATTGTSLSALFFSCTTVVLMRRFCTVARRAFPRLFPTALTSVPRSVKCFASLGVPAVECSLKCLVIWSRKRLETCTQGIVKPPYVDLGVNLMRNSKYDRSYRGYKVKTDTCRLRNISESGGCSVSALEDGISMHENGLHSRRAHAHAGSVDAVPLGCLRHRSVIRW